MNKYTIEVSKDELDVLEKGVELWASQPHTGNMMGAIFGAMLMPRDNPQAQADYKAKQAEELRKIDAEVRRRNVLALRLRAKLLEVSEREGEFLVHPNP